MSSLQYPFLVSDIDGTLLNSKNEISKENLRSISLFRRLGGCFTLATGRNYLESKRMIDQLELLFPVILCNGAILYEPATQSLLPIHTMSRDLMMAVLQDLEQKMPSAVDLFAYGVDRVYARKVSPQTQAWADQNDFQPEVIPSFEQIPDTPCIKIVAVGGPEEINLLQEWSRTIHLPVDFIASSDNYFEILPAGASKGNALARLLQKLHLVPEKAAAIGDHCNDLSMLSRAGLSAAVANAHPSVLQQAKVIVPSNDADGVSHLIHNHLIHPFSRAKTP
ncbi:Cof-type HAD-IIB family hydrolase [Paenactinomyces guangxiensis]|uniref:HAD family phosphatase n=1 Tax=Paenactinomyces guangxiensis TaxID=1490290 RepID=A0A7W1WP15_9BACL|nr:Cof-type HAD-IIB family hydrolase [Paenactinomyces guangxiensis]MBA4493417.1 HAD family phosphatase [Paenactinomyces guangxiensis]MBH8590508.1 HAD family phosphatase [Paenactinomyces guangxiensis]